MNEASEETSYTLVAEGGDVYADLRAPQAGAVPAVARALADLDGLRCQQEAQRLSISPDEVREALGRMKETLASDDVQAKRALLGALIVSLEISRGQAKVKYTFALACAGPHGVPPGRLERPRTASKVTTLSIELRSMPHSLKHSRTV